MAIYRFKYLYTGQDERHMPTLGRIVQPGDVIATENPINNPDFKLLEQLNEEKGEEEK